MESVRKTIDPYWISIASAPLDDIKEALITGYKKGKPFSPHNYHFFRDDIQNCRILDFGCGIGRNFSSLMPYARSLVAYDIPEMIGACRQLGTLTNVDLHDDWDKVNSMRFDVTVATLVLQHLIPDEALGWHLLEISRVSAYMYVSGRAWCDGSKNQNVLCEILDTGHFEFIRGSGSEKELRNIKHPDGTHIEFLVKSINYDGIPKPAEELFDDSDNQYINWIRLYDSPNHAYRQQVTQNVESWNNTPTISILLPTFDSNIAFLASAIESVRSQLYPHWELCIADDASSDKEIRRVLSEYARDDDRIKVQYCSTHGHISVTSNAALSLATGEFIALLDHDDLLSEDALYWVVREIHSHPNVNIIYSDEDKVDTDGQRFGPYFKPDWNPDLFLSHNLISHLGVYRTSLLKKVGKFTPGLEGAQDYDLALRISEYCDNQQIRHIPRVLYHWRTAPGSTALSLEEKPYATNAAIKAIRAHLQRTNKKASVGSAPEAKGAYRVRYQIPQPEPKVTIIIPTRNKADLLKQCVESILNKTDYPNYRLLIVDNDSDESETIHYIATLCDDDRANLLKVPGSFNYSKIVNRGVAEVESELIVLLNNDTEIINSDWLRELSSHALRPEIGIVGARLWYPNDTLQHAGIILGMGGVAGHISRGLPKNNSDYFGRTCVIQNFSAVTGACIAMRKSVFHELGGMDENHLPVTFNDIDLCLKAQANGFAIAWTPYADLYHHESTSRGPDDTPVKTLRAKREFQCVQKRWPHYFKCDPAHSPNLSLQNETVQFAFPPRQQHIIKQ